MDTTTLEKLRLCLLQALRAAAPHALPLSSLVLGARMAGFRGVDDNGLHAELQYLVDKGFAAQTDKDISPENAEWRITAAGRDSLAKAGL